MKLFNKQQFMPVVIYGITARGETLDGYTCSTQDLNATIERYVSEGRQNTVRVSVDIAITPPEKRQ